MDMTAVRRNLILFAWPTTLVVAGVIGMLACFGYDDNSEPLAGMVASIFRILFWVFAVLELGGLLWLVHNTWQLWRWMNGEMKGGCVECGGNMKQINGRWSQYSQCNMCASNRQGWH
jgi:hypothetical protein